MGEFVRIKWHGDKVIAAIQQKEAFFEGVGILVHGAAVQLCPIGVYPKGSARVGGNLSGSITWATSVDKSDIQSPADPKYNNGKDPGLSPHGKKDEVWVGTNVHYAPWVEKGTSKMKARPFLLPALNQSKGRIIALAKEVFGNKFKGIK